MRISSFVLKTKTSLVVQQAMVGLAANQSPTNRIFLSRSDKKTDAKYHFITIFVQAVRPPGRALLCLAEAEFLLERALDVGHC